jgi:tetratricopeptide (TPR) repeat protein
MKTSIKSLTIGLIVAGVTFLSEASAQTEKQIKQMEQEGLKAFRAQEYDKALSIYTKLDEVSSDPIKYDYMIGMCYLSTDAKEKALSYLRTAKDHSETSWIVNYYLGRAYMVEGNYLEAGNYLKTYKDSLTVLMSEVNFKFKVKGALINEANRVHMEKTIEDVNGFIAICDSKREEQNAVFVKSEK